jgi:hypothetical protein
MNKCFRVPVPIKHALGFEYPFSDFVDYCVDRVPEFQSLAGARRAMKLLDALELAMAGDVVRWEEGSHAHLVAYLRSEAFKAPQMQPINKETREPVGEPIAPRQFLVFADAIELAVDEALFEQPAA